MKYKVCGRLGKNLKAGWLALVLSVLPAFVVADEPPEDPAHAHDPANVWFIGRGGQLYDSWMATTMAEKPWGNHPAYPAIGNKRGYPTWRCKECHGWDYKGKDGAYRYGAHRTDIKGVRGVLGMEPAEIQKIIMNETHAFTEDQLPHSAVEMLSYFLSFEQIDMDKYIDRRTKKALGDFDEGAHAYQSVCALCHGYDGKKINFASQKYPSYVGSVCARNPWQALHKIRYGQPGTGMVALSNVDLGIVVDILSYCQTLPEE